MNLFGEIWTLGLWIKSRLMGHPSRNVKDRGAQGGLNCAGMAPDVSEEKNFNIWPRDHS